MFGNLMVIAVLLGAVSANDKFTCDDVKPFSNFSINQLRGQWILTSGYNFENGQLDAYSSHKMERLMFASEFMCYLYFEVKTTDTGIELAFPRNIISPIFDVEKEGYFAYRIDTSRKLVVLGVEASKYFAYVICYDDEIETVMLLSRLGGLTENEFNLITKKVETNLPFNTSYFIYYNQSYWNNTGVQACVNIPSSNSSAVSPIHDVSTNDMLGEWAVVSTISFSNGKPVVSMELRPTWCLYWQGTNASADGMRINIIEGSQAGNDSQLHEQIQLENTAVKGRFKLHSRRYENWEMIIVDMDSSKYMAVVMCLPENRDSLVFTIDVLSRFNNNSVISEEILLQIESRALAQLGIDKSNVLPVRHHQSCFAHQVTLSSRSL